MGHNILKSSLGMIKTYPTKAPFFLSSNSIKGEKNPYDLISFLSAFNHTTILWNKLLLTVRLSHSGMKWVSPWRHVIGTVQVSFYQSHHSTKYHCFKGLYKVMNQDTPHLLNTRISSWRFTLELTNIQIRNPITIDHNSCLQKARSFLRRQWIS